MRTKRLLIADDDAMNREIYRDLFEDDYEVEVVTDGQSCLAEFARARPDLLILDVAMPAMDGIEVCQHLRASPHYAELPILLVSGFDGEQQRDRGLAAGASAYIQKPFDLGEFEALVARLADDAACARA
ncbi:MAG: response regulator [Gammaproteobacteria bacterium]